MHFDLLKWVGDHVSDICGVSVLLGSASGIVGCGYMTATEKNKPSGWILPIAGGIAGFFLPILAFFAVVLSPLSVLFLGGYLVGRRHKRIGLVKEEISKALER